MDYPFPRIISECCFMWNTAKSFIPSRGVSYSTATINIYLNLLGLATWILSSIQPCSLISLVKSIGTISFLNCILPWLFWRTSIPRCSVNYDPISYLNNTFLFAIPHAQTILVCSSLLYPQWNLLLNFHKCTPFFYLLAWCHLSISTSDSYTDFTLHSIHWCIKFFGICNVPF